MVGQFLIHFYTFLHTFFIYFFVQFPGFFWLVLDYGGPPGPHNPKTIQKNLAEGVKNIEKRPGGGIRVEMKKMRECAALNRELLGTLVKCMGIHTKHANNFL